MALLDARARLARLENEASTADSSPLSITEIVRDKANTNENRAAECLVALDRLPSDDLARDDFRAAAQTFAMLALVDRLDRSSGSGYSLADAICQAGGIQP